MAQMPVTEFDDCKFECTGDCWFSFCCAPCAHAGAWKEIEETPSPSCVVMSLCWLIECFSGMQLPIWALMFTMERNNLAEKMGFDNKGKCCKDCCCAMWCWACYVPTSIRTAKKYKEAKARGGVMQMVGNPMQAMQAVV